MKIPNAPWSKKKPTIDISLCYRYKVSITTTLMGKHFGDLAFIRGIIYYTLSPHELKPFAGAIKHGIPNFVPRIMSRAWTWAPPFVFAIGLYNYIEGKYHQQLRKDPRDYIDEVDPSPPEPDPEPEPETDCHKKTKNE